MRVNMTDYISEREELAKLQYEFNTVMEQVTALQQENLNLEQKLQSNPKENLSIDEKMFSVSSYDDVIKGDSNI